MKIIPRLMRLRDTVKDVSGDPYVQGRAAQLAGGALIADGLVGLENPLDGKQSRAGIFGALFTMVVTVLFVLGALFIVGDSMEPYEDGVITTGTVVNVSRSTTTDSDGSTSTACSVDATFDVDGETYTASSQYSGSDLCVAAGSSVQVSYRPENPADAKVFTTLGRSLKWVFIVIPGFMFAIAAGTFVLRLISLIAGVWLFFWGRKRVKSSPEVDTTGVLERLQEAWGATAHHSPTSSQSPLPQASGLGGLLSVFGAAAGANDQPQPPSTGPPPGWYVDPQGSGGLRWWDGTAWTNHVQVNQPPPPSQ